MKRTTTSAQANRRNAKRRIDTRSWSRHRWGSDFAAAGGKVRRQREVPCSSTRALVRHRIRRKTTAHNTSSLKFETSWSFQLDGGRFGLKYLKMYIDQAKKNLGKKNIANKQVRLVIVSNNHIEKNLLSRFLSRFQCLVFLSNYSTVNTIEAFLA